MKFALGIGIGLVLGYLILGWPTTSGQVVFS